MSCQGSADGDRQTVVPLGRIKDPFGHHWEIGMPLLPWPPTPTSAPGIPITFTSGT